MSLKWTGLRHSATSTQCFALVICCTRAQQPKFTDSTNCQYQDSTDDEDRRCDIVNKNVQSVIVVPAAVYLFRILSGVEVFVAD